MVENTASSSIPRSSGSEDKAIRELKRKRNRKIQIIAGVVLIAAYFALSFYIHGSNPKGVFIMLIGLGFGYVLQRTRFCFTAALRDPSLTGSVSLSKAVIIAFLISSVLYAALHIGSTGFDLQALDISGLPGNIKDAGIHTLLGGFIFGIGAVIAGGCASGTLMRMGEGFTQQWIVIIFFIIGSVLGLAIMVPMKETVLYTAEKGYLPQLLGGWIPALLFQFGVLGGIYLFLDWFGKKKSGEL